MNNTQRMHCCFFTATMISQTGHNVMLNMQFQKVRDLLKLHRPASLQPAFGHYSEFQSSIQFRFNINLRSIMFPNRYHNFGYLNYNFFTRFWPLTSSLQSLSYFIRLDSVIPHVWRIFDAVKLRKLQLTTSKTLEMTQNTSSLQIFSCIRAVTVLLKWSEVGLLFSLHNYAVHC